MKASYTMSSIYFESSGLALETQPEFLGEYCLHQRNPVEMLQRKKTILKNADYQVKVRSYQMTNVDDSQIYYQKGEVVI